MPDDKVAVATLAAAIIRVRGKAELEDVKAALVAADLALREYQDADPNWSEPTAISFGG